MTFVVGELLLSALYVAVGASNGGRSSVTQPTVYSDPRELCEAETFRPVCSDGEVVVITEARYGRMQLGRCVQTDYGFVGCFSDVLEHLDAKCSGRRTCELRIPDSSLDSTQGCPREFKTYLNVSYECIPVESAACHTCSRHGFAKISLPSAYIGSIVTNETQQVLPCGSVKCPWIIEVQSGQTINITLLDYGMEQYGAAVGSAPAYISPESCFRYAVIKEAANHKGTPVCGGRGRSQVIYTSVTNTVEIHIVSPEVFSSKGQFLFLVEAVGCPDIDVPQNAEVKRVGDIATMTCENQRSLTWQQKCVGTQWVGQIGTCPGRITSENESTSTALPIGVLIAIVLGIALVIGVLIVTVGVVCLKRQRSEYARPYQPTYYVRGGGGGQCYELREDLQHQQLLPIDPVRMGGPGLAQPKFCGTLPPPKPPRPGGQQATRSSSVRGGVTGRENVYGAPRMDQRPLPSLPNIPEATGVDQGRQVRAAACVDPCACSHPAAPRPPPPQVGIRSPTRTPADPAVSSSAPSGPPGHIPMLACSVGGISGPPSQHYTVLDPNEVQQLLQGGAAVGGGHVAPSSCSGSAGCDPLAYGSSFQYLSSDDVTSCGSPSSATAGGLQQEVAGPSGHVPPTSESSCHEIPLRPARESSQPRIDGGSVAGSGSSGNSSWP